MRVLHLAGSPVDDFHAELSRLYAADCVSAIGPHDTVLAYVAPDRSWRFPASYAAADLAAAPPFPLARALPHLAALHVDVAVPQLFCRPGMTTYRALLDALGIPYVGNNPAVMAVGADKAWARAIVAAAGVAVPAATLVRAASATVPDLPVVVKPVDADNSVGVTLVRSASAYPAALAEALTHSSAALVETYVELGREVRCGVLERDGELLCLPLEEYAVSAAKPIRDRADKLARDSAGDLYLVAKDASRAWIVDSSDPVIEPVWAAARACYRALGCRHYGLFDFRVDPAGRPWFLEAGLYCSFARTSVVAVMAAAAGTPVDELFADTVRQLLREGIS